MSTTERVTVTIDGRTVEVAKGIRLIEACEQAGIEVPRFCYHPKLDSQPGVCRMCLVQVEKMPKPVTSCTTTVADGMVVHTQNERVQELQRGVLEFLLINHPLDCPVCDKGGECPLQDQTFKFGAATSRLADAKVRKGKSVHLGPSIVLDEERCVICRRCTRFDDEIAAEGNLIIAERGHENVVTTLEGQPFASYFSGNTIELCPVGALTSETYRFQARPWDLSSLPGVCTSCSVGCNTREDYRHGQLLRVLTRDNPATDNGWLCDRGRFNYKYVQGEERLHQPLVRRDGQLVPVGWAEALQAVADGLADAVKRHGADAVGVIGGGRLTLEEAYLLQKLARTGIGTPNVDHRVSGQVTTSVAGLTGRMTDLDDAGAILIVDLLPAETAPVLDLRVRRALERRGVPVLALGAALPKYRKRIGRVQVAPGLTAAVLAAAAAEVARRQDGRARVNGNGAAAAATTGLPDGAAAQVSDLLLGSSKTVVLWGGGDGAAGLALVHLLQQVNRPREGRTVQVLIPGEQANSHGAAWAGLLPGYLPGFQPVAVDANRQAFERAWQVRLPEKPGLGTAEMVAAAAKGQLQALYLVGANLAGTFPDGELVRQALAQIPFLVVQDLFLNETAAAADVVLPIAPFPNKVGHYAALDGLVQAVSDAAMPDDAQTDGTLFTALAGLLGRTWKGGERDVAREWQALVGGLAAGQVLPAAPADLLGRREEGGGTVAAPEPAASGTPLLLVPVERLFAGGGTAAHDPPIAHRRPRPEAFLHPKDLQRLGIAPGDAVRLSRGDTALDLVARPERSVLPGTVQVVRGLPEQPANRLQRGGAATVVDITRLTPAEVG